MPVVSPEHQEGTPAVAGVPARRSRRSVALLAGLALACAAAVAASTLGFRRATATPDTGQTTLGSATGTPAERRIAAARASLAAQPKRVEGWTELALALARRARETSNTAFYTEAWQATERALDLEPGHLEARKMQVWILLGQHEFARAVAAAEAINKQIPDDVLTYGFLTDGYSELGRYADAEKSAQWMLDIRPGNVPALTRAAHLRELFGDHEGAVELMDTAYRRTANSEVEDRAWILTQIAHLSLLTCRTAAAEQLLNEALATFPDYHYAVAQMAEVRTLQGRHADAATLLERHVAMAPHPENRFGLAVALERAGRSDDAQREFEAFEKAALAESQKWDSANVELILYYAEHAKRPGDAVALAKREATRRQDVRTLDALAVALHANGASGAARDAIDKVLAVGVVQADVFAHAAAIAAAQGDTAHATQWAERAVSTCPASPAAAAARALLATTR